MHVALVLHECDSSVTVMYSCMSTHVTILKHDKKSVPIPSITCMYIRIQNTCMQLGLIMLVTFMLHAQIFQQSSCTLHMCTSRVHAYMLIDYRITGLFREGKRSFTLQKTFAWFKIGSARQFHCHAQNFVWINIRFPSQVGERKEQTFGLTKQPAIRYCLFLLTSRKCCLNINYRYMKKY